MKKRHHYIPILLFVFLMPLDGAPDGCAYTDSLWSVRTKPEKQALLDNPQFAKMDDECFLKYLNRLSATLHEGTACSSLIASLKQFCTTKNGFSPSLLHAFLKKAAATQKNCKAADIVKLWEQYNGPIRYRFAQLEDRGLYPEADTLYGILHSMSTLDVYDLMKWAAIKGICGDYAGAAKIFCDISEGNNNLVAVARNQFAHQLETAGSPELRRKSLAIYRRCYLMQTGADTLSLSSWLSEIYSRFQLFKEEINAIIDLDRDPKSKGQRLLNAAQRRFIQGLFKEAVSPALESWKYISTEQEKQTCAIILYRAYAQTGAIDSSLIWLKKIRLATDQNKTDAVILYQKSGMFEKADSIIHTLINPVIKDSLTIRQFLFKGAFENAYSFASARSVSAHWKTAVSDNYLWKIRTASYCGLLPEATLYCDSLKASNYTPSWPYAAEFLEWRMAINRLESFPDAFSFLGRLSYLGYINKPQDAIKDLLKAQWPPEIMEYCAAALVEALIQKGLHDAAKDMMKKLPQLQSSLKISYFRALVDFNLGYADTAKQLFENIILSDPEDMYADKARIYLLKLKEIQSQ